MVKAALFTLVAGVFFAHWQIAHPSFEGRAAQSEWKFVLFFSAVLLLGLVGLTAAIAFGGHGRIRLLAFVPVGTITAVALYVFAGGPLMLATWLAAATLSYQNTERNATRW